MAEMIKKFLEKKKRDTKFKFAGPGHKLTESAPREPNNASGVQKRPEPCSDAKQAGIATLARLSAGTSMHTPGFSMYDNMRKQALQDSELKRPGRISSAAHEKEDKLSRMAVDGVFYRCPIIGPEVLPKNEWAGKIRAFLNDSLADDRGLAACLIIRSCNKNISKVEQCVSTLSTYLENIILNPKEEKYHRIRVHNKIFEDKVSRVEGSLDFLLAAGFENKTLPFKEAEEDFLVFRPEKMDIDSLKTLLDALKCAEPITIELDRNLKVLLASEASRKFQLPNDFFSISVEDIKREQQLRSERLDNALQLKTKAMREKEEQREMKKYKFAIIRVRFPDGVFLQGTFGVYEKFRAVKEFVRENLFEQGKFILSSGLGNQLTESDEESSLIELRLVPATLLIFAWDQEEIYTYLKPEVLQLMESL